MKYSLAIAVVAVAMISGAAFAEEGHVSNAQLAELGLPGMTVMSDTQGEEIRGQGFAFAASISASALPGTFSFDTAVALGRNNALAVSGAQSEASIEGGFFFFPPLVIGGFSLSANVGSSGYAFAHSD